ncbi:MAG: hypothetical protein ACOVP1_11690 [Bacteroidia bacterium]
MNIEISKIFSIQSHEWGGAYFLGIDNNINLSAIYLSPIYTKIYYNLETLNPAVYNDFFFTLIPVNESTTNGFYYLVKCIAKEYTSEFEASEIILWNNTSNSFYLEKFDVSVNYKTKWDILNIPSTTFVPSVFAFKLFYNNELKSNKYLSLGIIPIENNSIVNLTSSLTISTRSQLWYIRHYH